MAGNKECSHHHEDDDMDEMTDLEKYMAMKWGTPRAIASLLASLSFFLLSIGVFLWLLHMANIIK